MVSAEVEVSTQYRWQAESISGIKLKGKCYEIDIETAGQKYLSNVAPDKCRPSSKNEITFRWIPHKNAPGGTCYEVDLKTNGKGYSKYTNWRKCIPPAAQRKYVLNEGKCYLLGYFKEDQFIQGVSYDFCKSDQLSYQFRLNKSGLFGTCYEVDSITEVVRSTDLMKCRPKGEDSTQFIWEPNRGRCYEIAVDGGPTKYISAASKKKCKPKVQSYLWVQEEPPQCLEIGTMGDGSPYKNKVSDNLCLKDIATEFHFVKTTPISGICYEVDSETGGEKVRRKVYPSKCKDLVKEFDIEVIAYKGRNYCVERDKQEPSEGYRRSIDKRKCREQTSVFRWEQNDENPFEGKCLKLSHYLDKPIWTWVVKKNCKKGKTIYFWYRPEAYPAQWIKRQKQNKKFSAPLESVLGSKDNLIFFGKCYEIDKEKGPSIFSVATNIKNCKPKNIEDISIQYFHPLSYIHSGCYQVDKKTSGEKYLKKILNKECKDKFLKTKNQIKEENRKYGP